MRLKLVTFQNDSFARKALNSFIFSLLFVLLAGFFNPAQSQTLKTDDDVPALAVCHDAEVFTVRIASGAAACPNGQLSFKMPAGIEYVVGSAKVAGVPVPESNTSVSGATINVNIPAGSSTNEILITYEARAKCDAARTGGKEVDYSLTGCGTTQTGKSNAINIEYAVLNVNVDPAISQGLIGDVIERTVTVSNTGNGSITGFTVAATYGAGLERVSGGETGDWTFDPATNEYRYSGILSSGSGAGFSTISFTEKVKILSCADLSSSYKAFYGCDTECAQNGRVASPTIAIDQNKRPVINVTVVTNPVITCLNEKYLHTWKIKNNGTAMASNVLLKIGTSTAGGSSYMVPGSFTVGGIGVSSIMSDPISAGDGGVFGTTGQNKNADIVIPTLAPGEELIITFEQYYAKPSPTADCSQIPSSFRTGNTFYEGEYTNLQGCDEDGNPPVHTLTRVGTKGELTYGSSGVNIGEIDIVSGEDYQADYRIDDWFVSKEGVEAGAYFEYKITLSPSLAGSFNANDIKFFNGVTYLQAGTDFLVSGSGNTYTVRINYGSGLWPTGQDLNFSGQGWRLHFPLSVTCPTNEAYYQVAGSLSKGGSCAQVIPFRCQTVSLNAHCGDPCAAGGLSNGLAKLQRVSLGYRDADNDARPDNGIQLTLDDDLSDLEVRSFVGGDTLLIKQEGRVIGGTANPTGKWVNGSFKVNFPSGLTSQEIVNSGQVVVTRGGVTYVISNIPVTKTGNDYTVSLDINGWGSGVTATPALPAGFAFEDGDEIVSSLRVRIQTLSASSGLKSFPTTYSLIHNGTPYICGGGYTATGYYGPLNLATGRTTDKAFNMTDCSSQFAGPAWTGSLEIMNRSTRNALFVNEFRQFAHLRKVRFDVPTGLTLTGYRVEVYRNALTTPITADRVLATPVSGAMHEIDMKEVLESLKGGTNGGDLDEGFLIQVRPVVTINCNALKEESVTATSVFDGTFRYNNQDYYNATNVETVVQRLLFNTDSGKMEINVSAKDVNTLSAEANWIVTVKNNSANRDFANVWLGKSGGAQSTDLVRVQKIVSLTDTTHVGAPLQQTGGVFQIGQVAKESTSYYLITAEFDHCGKGEVEIKSGADCNGYPATVAGAACSYNPIKLTYTPQQAELQTAIRKQPGGTTFPKLCEPFEYLVEVNNAGGEAKDLKLNVPLAALAGLEYEPGSVKVSGAYEDEELNPVMTPLADQGNIIVDGAGLHINVPEASLPKLGSGSRFYVSFMVVVKTCEFQSGHHLEITPDGKNFCGSAIDKENLETAESNRIILEGAPKDEPTINLVSTVDVEVNQTGDGFEALYNFTLKNQGNGIFEVPLTGTLAKSLDAGSFVYSFAIKLPAGWEIAGNPQDLVPLTVATFKGIDPQKGYLFDINETLPVGAEIKIENAKLVYTASDAASLDCAHDFGLIHEQIFTVFTPTSACVPPVNCETELLTTENNTALKLGTPTPPTGSLNQEFCATDLPTLGDIVLANESFLAWFESATSTTELPATTVLEDGKTYCVANRLLTGSVCISTRLAVTIKIDEAPVANAGPDQISYDSGTFTLQGNQPAAGQTGLWTIVSKTVDPVVIADPSLYNTTVTIPEGGQAELKWTVTNGLCSEEDSAIVSFDRLVDLYISKKADKISYLVGDPITYTITVTNKGPGTLFSGQELTLTEALPVGLANVTYTTSGGTYTPTTSIFKLDSDLVKDGTVTLVVHALVEPDFVGTSLVNKVTVAPPTGVEDPNPDDNDDEETVTVSREADIAVSKTADKTNVIAGTALTYTITITNNGAATLLSGEVLTVKETLPVGFDGAVFTVSSGAFVPATGKLTLTAPMKKGDSITMTVKGTVAANFTGTSLVNKVDVSVPPGVTDPNLDNNDDDETTLVNRSTDLSVEKVADKTNVVAGEFITYTIKISNLGVSGLVSGEIIGVKETLPKELTNVTYATTDGVYDAQKQQLTLNKALPAGGVVTLTVSGKVASSTAQGATIVNRVDVTVPPGVTDPNIDNNDDDENTPVNRVTDLAVVKVVANDKPIMGTETVFTIKVTNNGPSDATGVKVKEVIPSGYTFVSSTVSKGAFAQGTGVWTVGDMVVGATETLTVTVKVLATGEYKNTANVTGNEPDPKPENDLSVVTPVPLASPPVAVDDRETTKANTPIDIVILANDYPGLTNSPLVPSSVEIMSQPKHGTLTVHADGTVTYTPNHGYVGEDTFEYRMKDELGFWSNVALVTITIEANDFFIPNIFTPNGDGTNDTFEIVGIEGFDRVALTIVNRWGNEVYRNDKYDNTWAGKGLNEGTYYYIITLYKAGTEKVVKGWVAIKSR